MSKSVPIAYMICLDKMPALDGRTDRRTEQQHLFDVCFPEQPG